MCNEMRKEHTKIPREGMAWKLFRLRGRRNYCQCFNSACPYISADNVWIDWLERVTDKIYKRESGFCAFRTRKEARRAKRDLEEYYFLYYRENPSWCPRIVLKKIAYQRGLGQHKEDNMLNKEVYETIIVKRFKIV